MRIVLNMIVKDEVDDLNRILTDYLKYFDGAYITITNQAKRKELEETCQRHGVNFNYFEWCNNFSEARNFAASQIKDSDYYFRLDSDDEIKNPECIRRIAEKALSLDMHLVYTRYVYSTDQDGNTNAEHYRETIVRCNQNLIWQKSIHENIVHKKPHFFRYVQDDELVIIHRIDENHAEKSLKRNIEYLISEYNRDKQNTDPRTLAYLGRTFMASKNFPLAKKFLIEHISKSGWDEDKYMSWCQLSEVYRFNEEYEKAISAGIEASIERPDYPDAYFKLADIYFDKEQWSKSIEWAKIGFSKKIPRTFMIYDPSNYTWRPTVSMAFCYLQLGEYEIALDLFMKAKKLAPTFDFIKENEKLFTEAVERKHFVEHFIWVAEYLKQNDKAKLQKLLDIVPKSVQDHEVMIKFKNSIIPPKRWSDKSVVILAGTTLEEWADHSVLSGIGGSEEAVIYLSRELSKLGYEVTVYNNCGSFEGTYNGVEYKNVFGLNLKDEFNIFISWRSNVFPSGLRAKKKLIWLHDVPLDGQYGDDEISTYDKIIVLSEFHKSLLSKDIPEDKIFVSSNGINLPDFKEPMLERNPHRAIYSSSYDRGLEQLLDMWPKVREAIPDAELYVCYGLNNFDKLIKDGHISPDFRNRIKKKIEDSKKYGVSENGRISHKQLIKEFHKSGVWAYPTAFPEISCITAMKAQACGTLPVTTNYAALKETIKLGAKVEGRITDEGVKEKYLELLINSMKDDEKQKEYWGMIKKHIPNFGWDSVAKQWHEELLQPQMVTV